MKILTNHLISSLQKLLELIDKHAPLKQMSRKRIKLAKNLGLQKEF